MPQVPHDLGNAGAHQESLEALLNSIVADLNELKAKFDAHTHDGIYAELDAIKTKFNAHTHTANDTAVIEGQQVALTLTDDPAIPSAQRPTIGTTASS